MLEDLGYTVKTAENGIQGLEISRKDSSFLDLVILDIIMPVMISTPGITLNSC